MFLTYKFQSRNSVPSGPVSSNDIVREVIHFCSLTHFTFWLSKVIIFSGSVRLPGRSRQNSIAEKLMNERTVIPVSLSDKS